MKFICENPAVITERIDAVLIPGRDRESAGYYPSFRMVRPRCAKIKYSPHLRGGRTNSRLHAISDPTTIRIRIAVDVCLHSSVARMGMVMRHGLFYAPMDSPLWGA